MVFQLSGGSSFGGIFGRGHLMWYNIRHVASMGSGKATLSGGYRLTIRGGRYGCVPLDGGGDDQMVVG